jgi:pilus assembly protein CpaE
MSTVPPNAVSLTGRRVLVLSAALLPLSQEPLTGAHAELGGLDRLIGVGPADADLIIIDADAWDAPQLAAGIQALTLAANPPPVLLVGAHLPTSVVRNLLRLERSDVLDAPYTTESIAAAISGVMTPKATSAPAHAPAPAAVQAGHVARCWAVTGAVGGSGATTIAIEIATQLCARQAKPKSVCLIDLNLADGSAAAYLGATPAMRLGDLTAAAERLDTAMLQAFITPVTDRLDLLAAARDPAAFDAVPREAILRMLEIACETYDWVILDMPRHRRSWSLETLSGCDEVLVVSELTVPALLAARSLSDEIERDMGSGEKPKIVLNRVAARMFGPAPSFAEAERALQRKAEAGVSSDWEAAAASVNLGGPISTHRPKSKIVKDVQTMVERLAAQPSRGHATKAA